jgi:hypothetical protein
MEREYALAMLAEYAQTGQSALYDDVISIDYDIKPPTIRQFLEDPFYAGGPAKAMFPLLKQDLIDIYETDYEEVIATGSIGYGKSWIASFGLGFDFLNLLCLRNPQKYFTDLGAQIAENTPIVMMNLSVTGGQAYGVLYSYVLQLMKNMPWMQQTFPNHDWKKLGLYFPEKNLQYKCGSSSEFGAIGQNVIGGAMDEANFMIGVRRSKRAQIAGETDQAAILFNQLSRRRDSRFMLKGGRVPSRFWLLSSKQFPGDFLERRLKQIQDAKGTEEETKVKVIDYSHWTPRQSLPNGGPYSGKNFYLFIGTAEHRSRILAEDASTVDGSKIEVPPGCKLLPVPIEYLKRFKEDLYGSIKDIAGHSILATNPFFDRESAYRDCILREDIGDVTRVHPYEFEVHDLISPSLIRWNRFPQTIDPKTRRRQSALNPGRKRFAHIDLSQTGDATGVAIGHYGGHKEIVSLTEVEHPDGSREFVEVVESRPVTIIDFMMKFTPPLGGRIDIKQVRVLVMAIATYLGWQWEEVTYDQFQSAESIAAWNAEGVKSYVFSVDRTDGPYQHLRSSAYDGRISYYAYPPLASDYGSLDWDAKKQKVDHRAGGTKDVSDTVAAVVAHVERHNPAIRGTATITKGHVVGLSPYDVKERNKFDKNIMGVTKSINEMLSESTYDPYDAADELTKQEMRFDPLNGEYDEDF